MAEDTDFNFGRHALRESPDITAEKIFEQGAWLGLRDPLNFWALNANNSKMTKDANFKFGTHAPDIPLKKFLNRAWLVSRDPVNYGC